MLFTHWVFNTILYTINNTRKDVNEERNTINSKFDEDNSEKLTILMYPSLPFVGGTCGHSFSTADRE